MTEFHLFIFALVSCAFENQKLLPRPASWSVSTMFFSNSFMVSGLQHNCLIHLILFSCMMRDRGLVSFLCMTFPHCMYFVGVFVKDELAVSLCMYIWVLYSLPLISLFSGHGHADLVTTASQYILKSSSVITPALSFPFMNARSLAKKCL